MKPEDRQKVQEKWGGLFPHRKDMIMFDGTAMESGFDMVPGTFPRREDIQPVPITETLLDTIQQVKPPERGVRCLDTGTADVFIWFREGRLVINAGGFIMQEVRFLHQLQQIYRSLTLGKELVIDLNAQQAELNRKSHGTTI